MIAVTGSLIASLLTGLAAIIFGTVGMVVSLANRRDQQRRDEAKEHELSEQTKLAAKKLARDELESIIAAQKALLIDYREEVDRALTQAGLARAQCAEMQVHLDECNHEGAKSRAQASRLAGRVSELERQLAALGGSA